MTYFTGIDVSLRSVSICGRGPPRRGLSGDQGRRACRRDRRLARLQSELKSAGFEAGALSQHLTYGLQAAGFEVEGIFSARRGIRCATTKPARASATRISVNFS